MIKVKLFKRLLIGTGIGFISLLAIIYMYGYKLNIYLIPPSPRKYVVVALEKMEESGIYSESKAWKEIKTKTLEKTKDASTYSEALPSLEEAVKVAGGKHSFIETSQTQFDHSEKFEPKAEVEQETLYLTVPEFTGTQVEANEYANILESALHQDNYTTIMIDLRGNRGGNMTPMILGLSALLPDGKLFEYIDKKQNTKSVDLSAGKLNSGGAAIELKNTHKINNKSIAILIDENTGSSGELTAICFKGLPNVKFFGSNSAGYTSANQEFYLYDGVKMQLTTAFIRDRSGSVYQNVSICPDIHTTESKQAALTWLNHKN